MTITNVVLPIMLICMRFVVVGARREGERGEGGGHKIYDCETTRDIRLNIYFLHKCSKQGLVLKYPCILLQLIDGRRLIVLVNSELISGSVSVV